MQKNYYTWCECCYLENEMKEIDAKRRDILVKVETLKAERNTVSAELLKLSATRRKYTDDKIAAMQTLSAEVKALDAELAKVTLN